MSKNWSDKDVIDYLVGDIHPEKARMLEQDAGFMATVAKEQEMNMPQSHENTPPSTPQHKTSTGNQASNGLWMKAGIATFTVLFAGLTFWGIQKMTVVDDKQMAKDIAESPVAPSEKSEKKAVPAPDVPSSPQKEERPDAIEKSTDDKQEIKTPDHSDINEKDETTSSPEVTKEERSVDNTSKQENNTTKPDDVTEKQEEEDVCNSTRISGDALTTSTCKHKSEGTIKILESKISGGEAPYTFSIDGENFATSSTFRNLKKGDFTIQIKDNNGCVDTLTTANVTEKSCSKSISVIIAPKEGSYWHMPVQGDNATVIIKTSKGKEVFTKTIVSGSPDVWKGHNNDGEELPADYYYFTLHYDTPDKDDLTGVITIMR